MKSKSSEIIILKKILRYMSELKRIVQMFNVKSYTDLENEYIALSSITQTITNVNELKKALSTEILSEIPFFAKIKTNTTRNIAIHSYDNISAYAVYSVMTALIAEENQNEIEMVVDKNEAS